MTMKIEIAKAVTLEEIHARCEEVGDCWIWQDAVSATGYPIMRRRPGPCLLVRRVAVELDGRPAAPRQPVAASCGDKRCCNPEHLAPTTLSAVGAAAAAKGAYSSPTRGAKIAKAKRATGKLTEAIAAEIRASDETGPVLAARYGVDKSLINSIRSGKAWKTYTGNFFAGLGARA